MIMCDYLKVDDVYKRILSRQCQGFEDIVVLEPLLKRALFDMAFNHLTVYTLFLEILHRDGWVQSDNQCLADGSIYTITINDVELYIEIPCSATSFNDRGPKMMAAMQSYLENSRRIKKLNPAYKIEGLSSIYWFLADMYGSPHREEAWKDLEDMFGKWEPANDI